MNHKRKRPKQSRAGCLLCKPNKLGKGMEKKLGHRGFGKLRKEAAATQDMIDVTYLWLLKRKGLAPAEAAKHLIGYSNTTDFEQSHKVQAAIRKKLGLPPET